MPGLGKCHELQVAVRLPEILDVADQSLVPIVDRLAERIGCPCSRLRIDVPSGRETKRCARQRKYVEAPVEHRIGSGLISRRVEVPGQRCHPGCPAFAARLERTNAADAEPFQPRLQRLPKPINDLGRVHRAEAAGSPNHLLNLVHGSPLAKRRGHAAQVALCVPAAPQRCERSSLARLPSASLTIPYIFLTKRPRDVANR